MCEMNQRKSWEIPDVKIKLPAKTTLPRWRKRFVAPATYGKPQPGDLIEIFRGTYQHWALYIGQGSIIHLAPPCEVAGSRLTCLTSVMYDKAVVMREDLGDVAGRDRFHVNNRLDSEHKPRSVCLIVRDALSLQGLEMPYCILSGNCEHFVTELRYGQAVSRQIRYTVKLGIRTMSLGMRILSTTTNCSSEQDKKKKKKSAS
ncbi:phospholipase A and acyltransferase 3-like [Chanos chanos]|uniref:Phospholipase A and acyltransferase 3-like n=1 Tax=Chanos chanos TaxID=29144 RepID=A0A6J2WX73_CHACN|nr:phospholipase A and acyltransferase 3-like [Chanos chanos]